MGWFGGGGYRGGSKGKPPGVIFNENVKTPNVNEDKSDTDRTRQILRDFAAEILPVATCVDDHKVEDAIGRFAKML